MAKIAIRDRAFFFSRSIPEPNTGCWLWEGAVNEKGYGRTSHNGRSTGAHRASWTVHFGEIPPGLFVCHKCDQPGCVNPDHLFVGTAADNNADTARKGRWRRDNNAVGERHGLSKLTEKDVIAIRTDPELKGLPQWKVAEKFGVTQALISHVRIRRLWGHVK